MLPSCRAVILAVALVLAPVTAATSHATEASSKDAAKKKPSRPEVYKVRPSSGDIDGGTVIMLRGKYFSKTKQVFFDKTPAADFDVISDKQLRIVSPPHVVGLYRIWVTTKYGRAKPGAFDGFRFIDDAVPPPPPPIGPVVTGLSPNEGTFFGGTTVTITGSNLDSTTQVTFDGTAATGLVISSPTSITVQAPPHSLGTVDVRVTTTFGTSLNTAADNYTYNLFD